MAVVNCFIVKEAHEMILWDDDLSRLVESGLITILLILHDLALEAELVEIAKLNKIVACFSVKFF